MKRFIVIACVLALSLFAASPAHAAHHHGGRGFGGGLGLLGGLFGNGLFGGGFGQQPVIIQTAPPVLGSSFGGVNAGFVGGVQSPVIVEQPAFGGGFGFLGGPFGGFGRFGGRFRR